MNSRLFIGAFAYRVLKTCIVALAALLGLIAQGQAAETVYQQIGLGELLARLPTIFGESVSVTGILTGWGEMAALDSDATREVMVDLRTLAPDLRQQINDTCTVERHCAATVAGKVVHIRGVDISELGVEAQTIEFEAIEATAARGAAAQ